MKRTSFMIAALLLMQGCSYSISPGVVQQADKNISFSELEAHPERYPGTLVIFGGTIDRIRNTTGATVIEVTQKKLDYWGKPLPPRWSAGSFVVVHAGFLDTLIFAPGRDITVAGIVNGARDLNLTSPVILSREIKLWPQERPSRNRPQYLDPLYDPYTSPRRF